MRYRWKVLSEDKRIHFQKKALEEKEATKAKISQQNNEEEAFKKDCKAKSSPTNKKSSKTSFQDLIKLENEVKMEAPFNYEPTFAKRPVPINQTIPNFYMAPQYVPDFNDFQNFGLGMFGVNNTETQNFNFNNNYTSNFSNLLSYLPSNLVQQPRRSIDLDFAFYPVKNDSSFYVKDENIDSYDNEEADPSTAGDLTMTPSSQMPGSSRTQLLNDCITSSLEDDFKLDGVEVKQFIRSYR